MSSGFDSQSTCNAREVPQAGKSGDRGSDIVNRIGIIQGPTYYTKLILFPTTRDLNSSFDFKLVLGHPHANLNGSGGHTEPTCRISQRRLRASCRRRRRSSSPIKGKANALSYYMGSQSTVLANLWKGDGPTPRNARRIHEGINPHPGLVFSSSAPGSPDSTD